MIIESILASFYPGVVFSAEYVSNCLGISEELAAESMIDIEKSGFLQLINAGQICNNKSSCECSKGCESIDVKNMRWILTKKGLSEVYRLRNILKEPSVSRDFRVFQTEKFDFSVVD